MIEKKGDMMRNKSWAVRVVGVFILLLALSLSALGAGINVHLTGQSGSGYAYDHKGTADSNKLGTNSVVQWLSANQPPDPADAVNLLHSGTPDPGYSGKIGDGTGGLTGTFDKNSNAASTSYLRIWENGGAGAGKYYITIGEFSVGDPLPTENYISSFQTKYKAAKPPRPKATAGGFSLSYDATTKMYLPSFSISAVDQNDAAEPGVLFETVGYKIAIRKKGDTTWKKTADAASLAIREADPANPYFVADGKTEYEVQAQAWNFFGGNGASDWSDPYYFMIPSSGSAGPVVPHKFDFLAPGANGNVTPTSMCFGTIGSDIQKASGLAAVINQANTSDPEFFVTVIYLTNKYDAAGDNIFAAFDKSGAVIGGTDFEMIAREPVQVYTTKAGTITK